MNYSTLDVQVPSDLNLQSNKNATPSTSQVIVTPDSSYNGLAQVTVAAMTSGTAGTPTATKGTVSNNQISITPSVTNLTGYITGGKKLGTAVTVSASELVSGTFIVSGAGNSQNVTNYATVSVNSGSATTPATTINATTTATLSTTTGLVSVNVSGSSSITPSVSSGWVSSGTAGTVSVSGSSSVQLNTKAGTTIYPSTSQQTAVASGYYTTGSVLVAAMTAMTLPTTTATTSSGTNKATIDFSNIQDRYINIPIGYNSTAANYKISQVPNGNVTTKSSFNATGATVSTGTNTVTFTKIGVDNTPSITAGYINFTEAQSATISLTASMTTKAAATYTPGTANQTIAAGQYLVGAQTISGDADLVASNIKKDVNIFGVTGTYEGSGSGGTVAPVGTVICMSTNTNPSTDLGGTWELVDKEFTSIHTVNASLTSDTANIFDPATNWTLEESGYTSAISPNHGCAMTRADHTIQLSIRLKSSSVALGESNVVLGTFNLTNLGLSSILDTLHLIGWSESGNGVIMARAMASENVDTSAWINQLVSTDAVTKTAGGSIAANSEILFTITFNCSKDVMLDSACDKFYFKKTSDTDYTIKTGAKTITANGTYNPINDNLDYYSQVTVNGRSDPGYLNVNGELVATFTYDKWAVADEGLTVTTYSTATSTLKASATSYGTYAADIANYNYTVVQDVLVYPVYNTSAPATAAGKVRGQMFHVVNDYCNYRSGFVVVDGTSSTTTTTTATTSQYRLVYNSSATAITMAAYSNYGYYMLPTAATFGSTISVTRPSLLQRGSTTYCTSAFVAAVSDVRYQWIAKIYRSPKDTRSTGGMIYSGMQNIADAFNSASRTLT